MINKLQLNIQTVGPDPSYYHFTLNLEGEGLSLSGSVTVQAEQTRVETSVRTIYYKREHQKHRDIIGYAADAIMEYFQDVFLSPQEPAKIEPPVEVPPQPEGKAAPEPKKKPQQGGSSPRYSSGMQSSRDIE